MDAWRAEHEAYVSAVIKMDPNDAGLQQTATNPLLNQARGFIAAAQHTGAYARGNIDLGTAKVEQLSPWPQPETAVVVACNHDALLLYDKRTHRPVSGASGRVTWELERSTIKNVTGIGWLVADNAITEGSTRAICAGH